MKKQNKLHCSMVGTRGKGVGGEEGKSCTPETYSVIDQCYLNKFDNF